MSGEWRTNPHPLARTCPDGAIDYKYIDIIDDEGVISRAVDPIMAFVSPFGAVVKWRPSDFEGYRFVNPHPPFVNV